MVSLSFSVSIKVLSTSTRKALLSLFICYNISLMGVYPKKLLENLKGITADSRRAKKGYLFVAIKGLTHDGHDYLGDVIKRGVKVVVGEKKIKVPPGITYFKVKDSRQALGELASEFYGNPSKKLTVIGVTGTKGKTTTCHLIYHLLGKLGQKVGLISSITSPGLHVTTPDVVLLHRTLKEMVAAGCKYAVIEVSSHGIQQKRIAGVNFSVGVLTNIAPEHLDYHRTFAEYRRVKLSFLHSAKIQILGKKDTQIDVLPGKFNNLNAQAAVDTVTALGFSREKAIKALQSFKLPAGRLEEIKNDRGFKVYIDFAHTPESLREVLTYLRQKTRGKLIAVFGCAGERDHRKRAKMGQISSELADISVFTAEDPRSENLFTILRQMRRKASNYVSIPERNEAIAYALGVARKGDTVAILGKGHEKSMSYQGFEHKWSDRVMVENILNSQPGIAAIVLAAGRGKRMKSPLPKVLHEICGRPMLAYTLENLRSAKIGEIILVVSFKKNLVIRRFNGAVKFAIQKNPAGGTADAARTGFRSLSDKVKTLVVINGDDSAFYKPETIQAVITAHQKKKAVLTFVSLIKDNPFGLGRVVRNKKGKVEAIIEEKEATEEQRKIKEVNDGLYVFERKWFSQNIRKVKKSPISKEFYLVDLVKIALDQNDPIFVYKLPDESQWQGINTPEQLKEANQKMATRLMVNG